jgi:hypothetical protein
VATHALRARNGRWLVLAIASAALTACLGGEAGAAEVRLEAENGCVEVSSIVDEVEGVIGRPLSTVPGVTFEIQIARSGARAWRLRLRTVEGVAAEGEASSAPRATHEAAAATSDAGSAPRATRELEGATCAEVASAAAVAIAVSIQEAAADEHAPAPAPPPASPAPAAPAVAQVGPPAAAPTRPQALAALLAVGDAGALPHLGVGGELDIAIALGQVRAVGLLSAFPPQDTSAGIAAGGRFTLMFGGVLGCAAPRLSRATLAACLGGELGRLAGEGTGATHPRLGSALWAAGRAELGLAVPVGPGWAVVVRGAVTVPLIRPDFEVNGTEHVYKPSAVGGRFAAGAEMSF